MSAVASACGGKARRRVLALVVVAFALALVLSVPAVGQATVDDTADADTDQAAESFFAVDIDNVELDVPDDPGFPVEGELAVEYTVENTGEATDTQEILLSVADEPVDSQEMTLEPGGSASGTFEVGEALPGPLGDTDAPEIAFTVAVSSADDTDEETVVVDPGPGEAVFEVTELSANEPVEGEDLVVTASLENTGTEADTQEVVVAAGELGSQQLERGLAAGESTTETVSFPTGAGDAGTYVVTVATEDDAAETEATVLPGDGEEAFFAVNITDVEVELPDDAGPVPAGELTVNYTVENTGEVTDTQEILLSVEDEPVDSQEMTLEPGGSASGTFEVGEEFPGPFEDTDPPEFEFTVAVSSADDTDEETVVVSPGEAVFEVTDLTTNTPVEGEDLTVTVEVTNTGDAAGSQTLVVAAGELGLESLERGLDAGESTTETVSFPTEAGDAGTYVVTAETFDDAAEAEATVLPDDGDEAFFAVNITDVETDLGDDPGAPPADIELTVNYTVENTGNASDTQEILLSVEDAPVASQEMTLDPGESASGTFEVGEELPGPLNDTDAPEIAFTVAVSSADDTDEETVAVDPGPGAAVFEVTELATNEPVEGEDLTVTVEVTNTGDAAGSQTLFVAAGELGSQQLELGLAAGESTTETVSFPTEAGDAGTYEVTAETFDDGESVEAEVLPDDGEEAFFAVEIDNVELAVSDAPGLPVEGELAVEYTVENTGNASDTQEILLSVADEPVASQAVSLEPGESASDTFAVGGEFPGPPNTDTTDAPEFEFTVAVSSEDDTAEETVVVDPGPGGAVFEVTELATNEPVAGENLTVTVGIENTGDEADTQEVVVAAGELGSELLAVELAANASTTETVSFPTAAGDDGTYVVTAATEDDAAETEATVLPGDGEASFFAVNITDVEADLGEDPGAPPVDIELTVNYTVENTGNASDTQELVLSVESLPVDSQEVSLAPGESADGTLGVAVTPPPTADADAPCEQGEPCEPAVTVAVSSDDDTDEETVTVNPVDPPPAVVGSAAPQDLNGDGLHRDVTGDGQMDIFDVQALFAHLDSPTIQNNPGAFNFAAAENPDAVTIFDVQALFDDLASM